jgi:phosphatidylserine decarboxylase
VARADGTVTVVDECMEEQYFKRRMKRVSIFLSVFDADVNGTPVAGEVLFTEGRGGALSGRRPSGGFQAQRKPALDHRIEKGSRTGRRPWKPDHGAIARRIVPWAVVGALNGESVSG